MNFSRTTRRHYVSALGCLLIFFSASCGSSNASESTAVEVTPATSSAQPVEYGASLSEWEAATQADTDQIVNDDGVRSNAEESQETGVATATIATTELDNEPSSTEATQAASTEASIENNDLPQFVLNDVTYQELMWDGLINADFTPDAIMAKYADQLAQIKDGSPEASALYTKMQEEFNSAPVNEALNETLVRIPGFIAPLEYTGDLITEFLLVPYFGACIHVPPPPVNQTVLVKTDEGYGIKPEDSYSPIWVMGKMTTEGATTTLADAGYYIQDAIIASYNSPQNK